jgi:hypothetical protein
MLTRLQPELTANRLQSNDKNSAAELATGATGRRWVVPAVD